MDINELSKDPDKIKQLISLLSSFLPDTNDDEETNDSPIKSKTTKLNSGKKRKNKFTDMPEKNMHKEDVEIDKKLQKGPPTPRSRESSLVEASCRICGRKEKISSGLVDSLDRYKCNQCSTSAG